MFLIDVFYGSWCCFETQGKRNCRGGEFIPLEEVVVTVYECFKVIQIGALKHAGVGCKDCNERSWSGAKELQGISIVESIIVVFGKTSYYKQYFSNFFVKFAT